jgi:molybdopterin converting factor small subunit
MQEVTVEFFGVPRQKAGRTELTVRASTIAEALRAIEQECPLIKGLTGDGGQLSTHYLISIDGREFTTDIGKELKTGSRLLLLSADAGG